MEIRKVFFNRMRNDAHYQFHRETLDLLDKLRAGFQMDVHTLEAIESYRKTIQLEDEAFKKITKSALTEKIRLLDVSRDAYYAALRAMNKSRCLDPDPLISDAAHRIQVVLDAYGNIGDKPLHEQTSAIDNLLRDLNKEVYKTDIQTADIKNWIADLERQNTALETLVKERYSEAAAKTHVKMKEARAQVNEAYNVIAKRINSLVTIQIPKPYENFVNTLNEVISRYMVKPQHHHNGETDE